MRPIAHITFGQDCSAQTSWLHLQLGEELLEDVSRARSWSAIHVNLNHCQLSIETAQELRYVIIVAVASQR